MTEPYDPEGNAGMDGVQERFRKGPASMREGDGVTKLTKRQSEVLRRMVAREKLVGHFDVWGGYWWTIGDVLLNTRTLDCLVDRNMVLPGATERVYSGRQATLYRITDAGRAAILSATKE